MHENDYTCAFGHGSFIELCSRFRRLDALLDHVMECRTSEASKQVRRLSRLFKDTASFEYFPVLLSRHFCGSIWKGRNEKSKTFKKNEFGQRIQKLKDTCFGVFKFL